MNDRLPSSGSSNRFSINRDARGWRSDSRDFDEIQITSRNTDDQDAAETADTPDTPDDIIDLQAEKTGMGKLVGFAMHPVVNMKSYVHRIFTTFGWRILVLFASVYMLIKGALYQFVSSATLPYVQNYMKQDGVVYQNIMIIQTCAWAMKGFIGGLSDVLPIFGFHKTPYLIGYTVLGSLSLLCLAWFDMKAVVVIVAIFFFLVSIQCSGTDILCEGRYAALMAQYPKSASDLPTWVNISYWLGALIASLFVGRIADREDPADIRLVFWICLPLAAQLLFVFGAGWLGEQRRAVGDRGLRVDFLKQHPKLFVLACATAMAATGQAFMALTNHEGFQFAYTATCAVCIPLLALWALPRTLAYATSYLFLINCSYVQIPGAMDYWYTAQEDCVPGGPHFDYTFYRSNTQIVASVFGLIGVLVWQMFFQGKSYHTAFLCTTIMRISSSVFDLIMVKRWNLLLGVSDKVGYMLGDAVLWQVASSIDFMPAVVLISKLCPSGVESTTYAILAGTMNFGMNVARMFGTKMMSAFNVSTSKPCNFENLDWLIVLGHMIFPIICIPTLYILVPKALLTEDLRPIVESEPTGLECIIARLKGRQPVNYSPVPGNDDEMISPNSRE